MSKALIEFRGIYKSFGDLAVLDDLNLVIERGVTTTIIGRSGVGKSVLLKHIAGLLAPDKGDIIYQDQSLLRMSRSDRKGFKRKFSYMFQNMALFDSMTVYENISLPLEEKTRLPKTAIRERVMKGAEQLDLHGIMEKYPSQISGGMCKRVALARALITEPEIILFDEPATGLDPVRKNAVYELITQCQGNFGFTAVVVSHDIPDVFRISKKVAMLERGRIVFEGTRDEILKCADPIVQRFIQGKEDPNDNV